MKLLILSLNYAPEPVGIGPYTTGMAATLAQGGHRVSVVTAVPYYPQWKVDDTYGGKWYQRTVEDGVEVIRCPIYVPARPTGIKRIAHYCSFALSALPLLVTKALVLKPDVVIAIAPALIAAQAARLASRMVAPAFGSTCRTSRSMPHSPRDFSTTEVWSRGSLGDSKNTRCRPIVSAPFRRKCAQNLSEKEFRRAAWSSSETGQASTR